MSVSYPLLADLDAGTVLRGTVGFKYRIDYRDTLDSFTQWQPLATITRTTNPYRFVDAQSNSQQKRFYRTIFVP
jgi:hypothetical protein